MKEVPEVLFVCVHNAGRSQMAAALLDHHARDGSLFAREARPRASASTPRSPMRWRRSASTCPWVDELCNPTVSTALRCRSIVALPQAFPPVACG